MREMKLEKVAGDNVCSWCFARDDTVLRHSESDTYWHKDCLEAAGDTIHHMIDWLPVNKNNRS